MFSLKLGYWLSSNLYCFFQGFKRFYFTPGEAGQVIAECEERIFRETGERKSFTVEEIRGGVLRDYLKDEDYMAPFKVSLVTGRKRSPERSRSPFPKTLAPATLLRARYLIYVLSIPVEGSYGQRA